MIYNITVGDRRENRLQLMNTLIGGITYEFLEEVAGDTYSFSIDEYISGAEVYITGGEISVTDILQAITPEDFKNLLDNFIVMGRDSTGSIKSMVALCNAFSWSSTTQGGPYWANIYDLLRDKGL